MSSIEGQLFLIKNTSISLSEENLVDCVYLDAYGNSIGCDGGIMSDAFQYVISNGGIDTEQSYPVKNAFLKRISTISRVFILFYYYLH